MGALSGSPGSLQWLWCSRLSVHRVSLMDRSRLNRIGHLALPLVGAMMSQTVLNLVDTAMVGFLGTDALAGVGTGSFVAFMATALVMGLSSGVQAMAARRVGEGRGNESAVPLTGGLVLALLVGLPLTIVLLALSASIFPLINSTPGVVNAGLPYYDALLLSITAVGMNFAFRGYWTGTSQSRVYMYVLLFIHVANAAISYTLIFGKFGMPELGTRGAGLGTTIALFLGTAIHFVLAWKRARKNGFLRRIPRRETMATMLQLAIPTAIQEFLFAAGFTAIFWIVGRMGTAETAGTNVLITMALVAILPAVGLGLAALTLVSEALGRNEPDEAYRWAWDVTKVAVVSLGLIGLPALLVPDLILAGFIYDPDVIAMTRPSLRLMGGTMFIDGIGLVLLHALLGAGAAKQVMVVSVGSQWLVGLPLAWLVGPQLGLGLFSVWTTQALYRTIQAAVFVELWRRRGWAGIKV
ncbi:MAG: MATE family efflux transporter [Rhodospirillaceae bacterium]|nr:MATE family efflux transporter [Rhodospirillaceae bacterium]MBT4490672.1 MATE family efflux transporter [Rhodospirillaceae bacterium]MBT5191509.1 MATE family efflux transporter [Rhodospirillaceae bacterium]MBT5894743.1 MATE family efflux transporter [Rhodospirillaceae bacterium]MBT6426814.1 MATE family efflux transporter [Rhodospirillaceae bacterium]